MPSTPRALGALEFPVPVLLRQRSTSPSAALAPVERGPASGWPARASRTVGRGSHPKGRSGAKDPRSGLTAADDRARGRRAPSEARAFGYVRTNSHVFQQSPPLPFGHFDAVRRAGIRLPPPATGPRRVGGVHSIPPCRHRLAPPVERAKACWIRLPTSVHDDRNRCSTSRNRCSTSSEIGVQLPPKNPVVQRVAFKEGG